MTGPEVLERAHAHLARHARLVIVVLLAYITVAGLLQASNRAFWFDEIFTVAIARLGSMTDVWQALAAAADTSPPGFFARRYFTKDLASFIVSSSTECLSIVCVQGYRLGLY